MYTWIKTGWWNPWSSRAFHAAEKKKVTLKSIKLMSFTIQLRTVVLCIYPYNRHHLEEHLGFRFSQSHVSSVPASSFQIQTIHIDTFQRRACDIIFHPFSDFIAQHYTVQSPSFVSPCYFLPKTDEDLEVTFLHMQRTIFLQAFIRNIFVWSQFTLSNLTFYTIHVYSISLLSKPAMGWYY